MMTEAQIQRRLEKMQDLAQVSENPYEKDAAFLACKQLKEKLREIRHGEPLEFWENESVENLKEYFFSQLPLNLHEDLVNAYLEQALVWPPFRWNKGSNGYSLDCNDVSIMVFGDKDEYICRWIIKDQYECEFFQDFHQAMMLGRRKAWENRKLFRLLDIEAPWTKNPATKNQLEWLRSCGYEDGIEDLTSGQACVIFNSSWLA